VIYENRGDEIYHMTKKIVVSILTLFILINEIGCYSRAQISTEEMQEISHGDEITITTKDMKTYLITVQRIEGTNIHGIQYTGEHGSEIVIKGEDITSIDMEKFDMGRTILIGCILFVVIASLGIIIPLPPY